MAEGTRSAIGFHEGECRENNVISFLESHRESFPEKIALKWAPPDEVALWDGTSGLTHDSITFRRLANQVGRIAKGLGDLGIGRGDRVLVFVPMSVELYLCMFAVQRIGAISVFLDSWARREHLGVCARTAEPVAMISPEGAFHLCDTIPPLDRIPFKIVVGKHSERYATSLDALLETRGESPIEPVAEETTALITFTTGSSGVPKGANRTHQFLAAQHRALDRCIPYLGQDVDLPLFPIFSLNNLAGGVTTVLPAIDLASPSERDAALLVNQMRSSGVTCSTLSPSNFRKIAAYCKENGISLSGLRRTVTGGAPVGKEDVRGFKEIAPNAEIWVLYGSTEVEPIAHIEAAEMMEDESENQGVNVGTIVRDLDHKFVRIHRDDIELGPQSWEEWEVEKGKIGELVVSGPHVCRDYYRNPGAVKATKIAEAEGKVWHRTGDLGYLDRKNRLWLVGRVHNVILRGSELLFPVQAEVLLKGLAFVNQAAFLGLPDEELGERACVVVSLRESHVREAREPLLEQIRRILSAGGIPVDEARIVEEIPMDPRHHSKVEYGKLKELLLRES
ncbi:MAG: AMP-binding protein [Armatimonadetes bacterium]|nr:AMP-binding protein [Armatimonadota bacterium]